MVLPAVRRPPEVVAGARSFIWAQFDQVAPTPYTLLVRALMALIRHALDQVRWRLGSSTRFAEGTSSTGRASVSKTEGWGFKSLVPCKS